MAETYSDWLQACPHTSRYVRQVASALPCFLAKKAIKMSTLSN